ncbi:magnesium transporter [Ornithinimicrobium avium]|uniref:Magnesium transporter MgtE n=1 Tax=Ornithinimicrobium avium TaxID=2283195 RepID=A0A345NLK9_9MICO|nr:magnesium transporter [Ornithinimicrobium avium]AXH95917.1 magnesium transporter [Ornithinimicrobium avium]
MSRARRTREQQQEQTRQAVREARLRRAGDAERLRAILHGADLPLVVDELERMNTRQRATAFRMLPRDSSVRALQMLEPAVQAELVEALPDAQARLLVAELDPDDRARLLDGLPMDLSERLLRSLTPQEWEATAAVLSHRPETVGRWSTPRLVSVSQEATVADALRAVRADTGDAETVYAVPVVDAEHRVVGVVSLRRLLATDPGRPVHEVMREPISVYASDDQEDAARVVRDHGALAVPVLDDDHRLVGMFTVDDAMRVLQIEEAEDEARAVGRERLDRPYLTTSFLALARGRITWLLILIVAATLTVNVLDHFEDQLQQVVSLALFIPLLIGTGGNIGAQAASTMIRALAIDDVRPGDVFRVMVKELTTGLTLGVALAVFAYLPAQFFTESRVALVISLSLVVVCGLAATAGGVIPLVARRLGVDPAVVSAPFITTFVDATGLVVYFLIAGAVLGL